MIHADRLAVPPPKSLSLPDVDNAREQAARFFGTRAYRSNDQMRFEFNRRIWLSPDVTSALVRLFHSKCAFCESPINTSTLVVNHFRPTANTKDPVSGKASRERYYWLAYEWENLYAACATCAKHQANQFPIKGIPASDGITGKELRLERPLLLDPCFDRPETSLDFLSSGIVVARDERGDVTIRIFGLNRDELVHRRAEVAKVAESRVRQAPIGLPTSPSMLRALEQLLDPSLPYAAVRRAVVQQVLALRGHWTSDDLIKALSSVSLDHTWVNTTQAETAEAQTGRVKSPSTPPEPETGEKKSRRDRSVVPVAAVAAPPPPAAVPQSVPTTTGAAYIERIELKNFRAIRHLAIDLLKVAPAEVNDPTSTGTDRPPRQPWLVLLGENGAGKSSVLQALAYALMGEEQARAFLDPAKILRRAAEGESPPRNGYVRVQLSTETIEFSFTRKKVTWKKGVEGAGVFLRGYGSTRLLPKAGHEQENPEQLVRVDNLFDPFEPLNDAIRWLAALHAEAETAPPDAPSDAPAAQALQKFNAAAIAFKDLLRLENEKRLRYEEGEGMVLLDQEKIPTPLSQLSDGYQTVIALAADIMAGVPRGESDFATCPGIILLDELGTHLHPRWRMEIVKGLRSAFSSMQFIATTHEPLCLRGLGKGEVVVVAREGGELRTTASLPSPMSMRVDQLLTSRYFGLFTTIDPELDEDFREYYDLLARERSLSPDEETRRDQLKTKLQPYRVLGYTRRDQLVAEVLDEYFAKERTSRSPEKLRDETKRKVAEIWERISIPEVAR